MAGTVKRAADINPGDYITVPYFGRIRVASVRRPSPKVVVVDWESGDTIYFEDDKVMVETI